MAKDHPNPRYQRLLAWTGRALQRRDLSLEAASEDASFRRYWRASAGGDSWIIMDAPPPHENCAPFVALSRRLRAARVNAPEILAQDLDQGFLLLSDFGTTRYLDVLDAGNANALYSDATQALLRMQRDIDAHDLPDYDAAILHQEMMLFPDWLLARHLNIDIASEFEQLLQQSMALLIEAALAQPRVFVHLDYHSRNLMLTDSHNPGVLDFQDARRGPITYDLVSLLRDCYLRWPEPQVLEWSEDYRLTLQQTGIANIDASQWRRWFDWMGIQRHLKAAGIFARLWHRDQKQWFLADIPRTVTYIRDVAQRYPELHALAGLLDQQVLPALAAAATPG